MAARTATSDPRRVKPEARARSVLDAVTAETSLDDLTNGWFSKALRAPSAGDRASIAGDTDTSRSHTATAGTDLPRTKSAREDSAAGDANDATRDASARAQDAPTAVRGRDAPHPSTGAQAKIPSK
ncbi:MAG: hypothetical protein R3F14_39625 [Polyangiaceae bacterium]